MNHVKILGLIAFAAVALMAFAATAGATSVTTGGTVAASSFSATNESNLTLTGSGLEVTCKHSAIAGSISSQGSGKTASGSISTLTFGECTQHVKVNAKGSLEAHWTSGSNGALTGSGSTIEIDYTTIFGTVHCNFVTSGTGLGTITGAVNHSTAHATLDINGANIPTEVEGSNGLCPVFAIWAGSYSFTSPAGATIDQN